ncbi:hypothetical protein AB0K40_17650 [Nonomuraea bangladeshensis]|uniref:Uncharacterized protein n=1 Tax=Nonomuraea bangladeshensis TaxID=404385 RepID=A0ABV3H474_9ACTN
MHWHAYKWNGNGADRANEAERRPNSPDFPTSPLPPMRTGDWLAKPASRIAATFHKVEDAVEWLAAESKAHPELICQARAYWEDRLAIAREALPLGVDVQWGEWLKGGRFLSLGLICCPNRHVLHPCPTTSHAAVGTP